MKRKFGFVIGACMIIGMIDLGTEKVVFSAVYNPLNPSEEIVPTDPPKEVTEKVEDLPTQTDKSDEQPTPDSENISKDQQDISSKSQKDIFDTKTMFSKRVILEDIFAPDPMKINLTLPVNNMDGDDDDKPTYMANLCDIFSGTVLYGQKKTGGLKTHVCDIFE